MKYFAHLKTESSVFLSGGGGRGGGGSFHKSAIGSEPPSVPVRNVLIFIFSFSQLTTLLGLTTLLRITYLGLVLCMF